MEKELLQCLFYSIQDDLDDSWKYYRAALKMSMHNNTEMANYFINDAKARLQHSETVKEKISYVLRQMKSVDDSAYKSFYTYTLEKLDELKMKVMKFKP